MMPIKAETQNDFNSNMKIEKSAADTNEYEDENLA